MRGMKCFQDFPKKVRIHLYQNKYDHTKSLPLRFPLGGVCVYDAPVFVCVACI